MHDYQKQHYYCEVCNKFTPHMIVQQNEDNKPEPHSPAKEVLFRIIAALIELIMKDPASGVSGRYHGHAEQTYMCEKCGETTTF